MISSVNEKKIGQIYAVFKLSSKLLFFKQRILISSQCDQIRRKQLVITTIGFRNNSMFMLSQWHEYYTA